jgi:hypothetical protein
MGFTVKKQVEPDKDEGYVGQLEKRKSKIETIPNENGFPEDVITRA